MLTQQNGTTRKQNTQNLDLMADRFFELFKNLSTLTLKMSRILISETFHQRIPVFPYFFLNFVLITVHLKGIDTAIVAENPLGYKILFKVYSSPLLYMLYKTFIGVLSGPLLWAFIQSIKEIRREKEIIRALKAANLYASKLSNPKVIFDKKLDADTRQMRLRKGIYSKKHFQASKEDLESNLKCHIELIEDNISKGSIDLFYSFTTLEKKIPRPSTPTPLQKSETSFLVGRARTRWIWSSFQKTPHLLVGGQTNSGKSNLLRGFIHELYTSYPKMKFFLLDLKEGVEFQVFQGLKRCEIVEDQILASELLEKADGIMRSRLKKIKKAQCVDIDQYNKSVPKTKRLGRILIVVDEASQLFSTSRSEHFKFIKKSTSLVRDIAALGRAAGLHLLLATQKPEKRSVDTSIKTNLQGRLSFKMSDNTSSLVILDTIRARQLPAINGRAIWQDELEQIEIQIPWNDPEAIKKSISEIKLQEKESTPEPSKELKQKKQSPLKQTISD